MKRIEKVFFGFLMLILLFVVSIFVAPDLYSQDSKYPQVDTMNNSEFHLSIHEELGIYPPEYYDWEETANSIGIDVDSLTIDLYYASFGIEILNEDLWEWTKIESKYRQEYFPNK